MKFSILAILLILPLIVSAIPELHQCLEKCLARKNPQMSISCQRSCYKQYFPGSSMVTNYSQCIAICSGVKDVFKAICHEACLHFFEETGKRERGDSSASEQSSSKKGKSKA